MQMFWSSLLVVGLSQFAQAEPAPEVATPTRTALKVCADPAQPPSSTQKLDGYENKIVDLFARSLGLPVEYTWFPQRIGFIRNTLNYDQTETGEFRCDLVLTVPEGFDLAATTKPYFRSTWVMVYAKGRGLDSVKKPEDLVSLPPEVKKTLRIGLFDRSPAAVWLANNDLTEYMIPYQSMNGDIQDYPGRIIEQDLVQDKINVTFVWGPIGGYAAKRASEQSGVELVVIPMESTPGLKFDFAMSMAVRHRDKQWKEEVNQLLIKHEDEIKQILTDFGVPMLPLAAVQPEKDDD
jgi:mxaJ protein